MASKIWPAVGKCIYCGSDTGLLTDEHIVPFGLGGTEILPAASCKACEKITGKFEQTCLRTILGPIRVRMELPTRRKKLRPASLPFTVNHEDGTKTQHLIPVGDHPTTFTMFNLEPARILFGLPAFQPQTFRATIWTGLTPQGMETIRRKYGGRGFDVGRFEVRSFVRMIAKIGHSYAVANCGLESFEPLLTDIILGKPHPIGHLVGGTLESEPKDK